MTNTEDPSLEVFGKRIATLRKAKGLTQVQLAEQIGVTTVSIAYIETGKRWTRLETLKRIAGVLGVDVADLFVGV